MEKKKILSTLPLFNLTKAFFLKLKDYMLAYIGT